MNLTGGGSQTVQDLRCGEKRYNFDTRSGSGRASGHGQAPPHELSVEIELGRSDRNAAGHGPEDLELETVGVLRVKGETHAVVRRADERPRVEEALTRSRQIGEVADFPRRVVHARHALVGPRDAGLLEQTEMMVVGGARDGKERRVGKALFHLEAADLAGK